MQGRLRLEGLASVLFDEEFIKRLEFELAILVQTAPAELLPDPKDEGLLTIHQR